MELREKINEFAVGLLADESQFIVDVIVSSKRGPTKVLVILDGDRGVNIDDCAEQPLKLKRQYRKNIGRGLKVKLRDKMVEGLLSEVADETITLTQKVKEKNQQENAITVSFGDIEKAFVTISFK